MPKKLRSLYQCENARVFLDRIICGHGNISLPLHLLKQGKPLELGVCQNCIDFDYMGEAVPKEDRGWRD